jgi:hypothetical protein
MQMQLQSRNSMIGSFYFCRSWPPTVHSVGGVCCGCFPVAGVTHDFVMKRRQKEDEHATGTGRLGTCRGVERWQQGNAV